MTDIDTAIKDTVKEQIEFETLKEEIERCLTKLKELETTAELKTTELIERMTTLESFLQEKEDAHVNALSELKTEMQAYQTSLSAEWQAWMAQWEAEELEEMAEKLEEEEIKEPAVAVVDEEGPEEVENQEERILPRYQIV